MLVIEDGEGSGRSNKRAAGARKGRSGGAGTIGADEEIGYLGTGRPVKEGRRRKSNVPTWARLCTIFGAVLVVLSAAVLVGFETMLARYEGAVAEEDLFGDKAAGAAARGEEVRHQGPAEHPAGRHRPTAAGDAATG